MKDKRLTRRAYLLRTAFLAGADYFLAQEAVATTLMEHPELDPDELRTLEEWEE
jgi:uncharacterized protein YneF (UPF0154 family)